jgi:hypothetical protein
MHITVLYVCMYACRYQEQAAKESNVWSVLHQLLLAIQTTESDQKVSYHHHSTLQCSLLFTTHVLIATQILEAYATGSAELQRLCDLSGVTADGTHDVMHQLQCAFADQAEITNTLTGITATHHSVGYHHHHACQNN